MEGFDTEDNDGMRAISKHLSTESYYTFFRLLPATLVAPSGFVSILGICVLLRERLDVGLVSDPRDAVFALVGLHSSTDIQPDYTLTTSETYINATAHCPRNGELAVLEYAFCRRLGLPQPLPSWVVDWTAGSPELSRQDLEMLKRQKHRVSFTFKRVDPGSTAPDNALHIGGVSAGQVAHIIHPMLDDLSGAMPWEDYSSVARDVCDKKLHELASLLQQTMPDEFGTSAVSAIIHAGCRSADPDIMPESLLIMQVGQALGYSSSTEDPMDVSEERAPKTLVKRRTTLTTTENHNTVAQKVISKFLHSELVVFDSGLCAFNGHPQLDLRTGDELALFFGAAQPLLVRETGVKGTATLIGPIGVVGLEERLEKLLCNPTVQKTFTLV